MLFTDDFPQSTSSCSSDLAADCVLLVPKVLSSSLCAVL